jgi:hypothetical protein
MMSTVGAGELVIDQIISGQAALISRVHSFRASALPQAEFLLRLTAVVVCCW